MNVVVLQGNLTKDIDVKSNFKKDKTMATFTLAINGYNDSVSFIPCVVFGKLADTMEKYLKKGDKVCVKGSLYQTTNEWKHKGEKVKLENISVTVNEFSFCSSKKEN